MRDLIAVSEKLPHKNEYHLPSDLNWKTIWLSYCDRSPDSKPASYTFFKQQHAKKWSKIKIAPYNTLGSCDTCNDFNAISAGIKVNGVVVTEDMVQQHKKHLEDQEKERVAYTDRTKAASSLPETYASIITDGMQPKYLPLKVPADKSLVLGKRFKLHVTGAIEHRRSDKLSFYVNLEHWPHDPNYTISILHHQIRMLVRDTKRANGVRPQVLYVQFDNCFRENKNRWMLAYFCYLIHLGWFKEIQMHCLIQGHTHEDIDQSFSIWSQGMKSNGYLSMSGVRKFVKETYKRKETPAVYFPGFSKRTCSLCDLLF
jgi:hypothetical protein